MNIFTFFVYIFRLEDLNIIDFIGEFYDSLKRMKTFNVFSEFDIKKNIFHIILTFYNCLIIIFFGAIVLGPDFGILNVKFKNKHLHKLTIIICISMSFIYWAIYFFLQTSIIMIISICMFFFENFPSFLKDFKSYIRTIKKVRNIMFG